LFILLVLLFFFKVLPLCVFLLPSCSVLSRSLSLTSRKSFEPFSGLLNHECGDFSILVRVIYLTSLFNIVEGSYRTN
jgi:hypothetical protein